MYCLKRGKLAPEGAETCPKCGARLPRTAAERFAFILRTFEILGRIDNKKWRRANLALAFVVSTPLLFLLGFLLYLKLWG